MAGLNRRCSAPGMCRGRPLAAPSRHSAPAAPSSAFLPCLPKYPEPLHPCVAPLHAVPATDLIEGLTSLRDATAAASGSMPGAAVRVLVLQAMDVAVEGEQARARVSMREVEDWHRRHIGPLQADRNKLGRRLEMVTARAEAAAAEVARLRQEARERERQVRWVRRGSRLAVGAACLAVGTLLGGSAERSASAAAASAAAQLSTPAHRPAAGRGRWPFDARSI
jgi:hypothetical protein